MPGWWINAQDGQQVQSCGRNSRMDTCREKRRGGKGGGWRERREMGRERGEERAGRRDKRNVWWREVIELQKKRCPSTTQYTRLSLSWLLCHACNSLVCGLCA